MTTLRAFWHDAPVWLRAGTFLALAFACALHMTTSINGATLAAVACLAAATHEATKENA